VSSRSRTDAPSHHHHSITVLVGQLSHDPLRRELPSGSVVMSFDVSVRTDDRPGESVPVAWTDPPSRPILAAGDEVLVVGRTRRRFFRAGGATASRTEVVAERVVPVRQRARWAAAVADADQRVAAIDAGHR
jgi:single-strand DNA-binding protein